MSRVKQTSITHRSLKTQYCSNQTQIFTRLEVLCPAYLSLSICSFPLSILLFPTHLQLFTVQNNDKCLR